MGKKPINSLVLPQCKCDIVDYLEQEGWGKYHPGYITSIINGVSGLFNEDGSIYCCNLWICTKSKEKNILSLYGDSADRINKYFLEFIGYILRKYDITIFEVNSNRYTSKNWEFNNIKRLNGKYDIKL